MKDHFPGARGFALKTALVSMTLASLAAVSAGEVVITWVEAKQQPLQGRAGRVLQDDEAMAKALEQTRKALGEEAAAKMAVALEQVGELPQVDPSYSFYPFGVENRDQVRRVDRIEVRAAFFDNQGEKLGERVISYDLELGPNQDDRLTVTCESEACLESSRVELTIESAEYTELDFGDENEIAFGWNDSRWFLEDRWQDERTLTLRSFSAGHYRDQGYDGRVFPEGKIANEEGRYYRLLREPLPAGFPDDPVAYEFEDGAVGGYSYAYGLLPGFVVKGGARAKPGLLDGEISNLDTKGTIEPGEMVQIRALEADKKSLMLVVSPVCQLRSGHRALRGRVRFVLDRAVLKGPDHEAIDRAVREILEPVPVGEVAERCGPNSGTLVKRWTAETTAAQIEDEWGTPDARTETADGEVLAFGAIRLRFRDGLLDGYEHRRDP